VGDGVFLAMRSGGELEARGFLLLENKGRSKRKGAEKGRENHFISKEVDLHSSPLQIRDSMIELNSLRHPRPSLSDRKQKTAMVMVNAFFHPYHIAWRPLFRPMLDSISSVSHLKLLPFFAMPSK
jgi:hypothetical protein